MAAQDATAWKQTLYMEIGHLVRKQRERSGLSLRDVAFKKLEQLCDLYMDIFQETTDEDPRDVVLRAMAVYRSFVKHARAGGQAKFVGVGPDRVLKVRLR